MDGSNPTPSSQLLEANRTLYELRVQAQVQRQTANVQHPTGKKRYSGTSHKGDHSLKTDCCSFIAHLPDHLGWGSEVLTAVLRHCHQESDYVDNSQDWLKHLLDLSREESRDTAVSSSSTINNIQSTPSNNQQHLAESQQTNSWVKLYPDIGLGMLRQELAAPGRLWLMLRYLDNEGSGLLRIDILARHLTKKSSPLRLCGKRQLRNLLQAGEGVYWTRDKEHIWLRSAAKVAYTLGVERLTGRPVALPIAALLDGIGAFRAHLYAAFHSGRTKDTPYGEQAMPIARETMEQLSGVGQSSQRAYEDRVGIAVQANFAVGEVATEENQENRAWVQGQALFELKDYRGQQGKKGKTYLAWQLPNTYLGQHRHRPRGRQKRINRELKDLVMKGMPGNVGGTSETQKPEKVYYPNGKLAAKAYGRDPERELYWKRHRTGNGRFDLWQQLGGT